MDLTSWIAEEPTEAKPETTLETVESKETTAGENSRIQKKEYDAPWCEKYRPTTIEDVIGNESSIVTAKKWVDQWTAARPKKNALLIYGTVGTGKTTLSYNLAKESGWEVLEMNASDKRNKEVIERIAGLGSQTKTFSGKRRVLIVEEIDGLSGIADRGASNALIDVIKKSKTPIILTCNDIKDKKLGSLKTYCEQIELKKISPGPMVKALGKILEKEGIKIEDIKVLQKIADNSDGDMRCAINDLQAVAQGEEMVKVDSIFLEQRDRKMDVYKAMQKIFKSTDYAKCRRIMWELDEEPRNFVTWLDENIPIEYQTKHERAKAFNQLSRADIFLGRITNRQYWGFLRYVNDLMTVGVSFSKDKVNFSFNKYRFPSLIMKMGSSRGNRAKESSIATKISPIVHDSKHQIITEYIPLLKHVFEKNHDAGQDMVQKFDLDEEEIDYLS